MKETTGTKAQSASFGKRQDFGEVIPGSRKDRAQTTKRVFDDLVAMESEAAAFTSAQVAAKLLEIRRDDIWGSLDERLSQLQSQGASPALALAWRVLYRGVAASAASMELKPTHGRFYHLSPRKAYIFGLCYESALKGIAADLEALPLDVTWPELNSLALTPSIHLGYTDGSMIVNELGNYLDENPTMSTADAADNWLRFAPTNNLEPRNLISLVRKKGQRPSSSLSEAKEEVFAEYAPGWSKQKHLLIEKSFTCDNEDDVRNSFGSRISSHLSHAIIGEYPEMSEHGYLTPEQKTHLDQHFGSFDLLAEELYSRIAAAPGFDPWTTIKSKKSTKTEGDSLPFESILRPKVMPPTRFEHLKREAKNGAPTPRQGNVSEAELIELVPFRGIQYGNWATQAERQEMLNMAYDAMSDLALALGVSPHYLVLPVPSASGPQALGLALGARGRGGNVAAHYEPTGHVINLTKTKGGGALAHEWMHAYDHKVGTELTVRVSLASEIAGNEVYDFVKLLRRSSPTHNTDAIEDAKMRRRDMMIELLLPPSVEKELFEVSGSAGSWQVFGAAMAETIAEWSLAPSPVMTYACEGRYLKRELAQSNMQSGLAEREVPLVAAEALSTLWSERIPSSDWIKLDRRLRREGKAHWGQSAYLANAEVLNGNKAVGYWSAQTELLARAGSAVVFDRLREIHGVANGFLDASSDPERFNPGIHKANPNPVGAERQSFRKAFSETLLVSMQKEDASATYSQKPGTQMRMRF